MVLIRPVACLGALGLVAAAVSGCAAIPADATPNSITAQRAEYVATMLKNTAAANPETEAAVMSVIAGYGGGYVTDTSLSGGPGPSLKLALTVVLGGGSVRNSMQGEQDFGPAGIDCYTFTVGYYDYSVSKTKISCPASLSDAAAETAATRQIAAQVAAEQYDGQIASETIPASLAAAERQIGLVRTPSGTAAATVALLDAVTAADFAAGTDPVQHLPAAALALPQPGGGCVYVNYRWIRSSTAGGGAARTFDDAFTHAWAAPTNAPCTGAAALTAVAFLTVDRYAGG